METHEIDTLSGRLFVKGEYDPGEPTVMYHSDMSGHPGTPKSFEIHSIIDDNDNEIIDDENQLAIYGGIESIEEYVLNQRY